ncbi:hypothetical protein BEP19_14910 [Ammoniphilus oxalaticus]|uniref:Terminase n=1 Tax=Ammoniphilus oxalaticus TaxID=66863 RepID=A0A419SCY2_9BACL|nr:hypothetical protein [Ammoniphilus oxalaticus]RKD20972.1 hypothetical protein BEP19_14910 [Ammoniphilus oxalaticus]
MPNWDEIRNEWETTKITFRALAEKHGVKDSTIRSRKNRENWQRNDAAQRATKKNSVATEKDKGVASNKGDTSYKGQKRRSGNPNPSHRFPNHNSFQLKHGLYSKFLHKEQVEIIKAMEGSSFIDQLWMQIEIKFSAIVRMQRIMGVDDEWDHLKEKSGHSSGVEGDSTTYKVIYAHERFESYIRAQTRAMAEYRNLVRQYIELVDEFDERRLNLELMQARVDKTKAEIENISSNTKNDGADDWVAAIKEAAERRKVNRDE